MHATFTWRARIRTVRVVYKAPLGTTSLEVFRDHEQMLADLGFEETFKLDTGTLRRSRQRISNSVSIFRLAMRRATTTRTPVSGSKNQYYLTPGLVRDGQTINAAVYVAESDGLEWQEPTVAS
jgi:hypothetical protein